MKVGWDRRDACAAGIVPRCSIGLSQHPNVHIPILSLYSTSKHAPTPVYQFSLSHYRIYLDLDIYYTVLPTSQLDYFMHTERKLIPLAQCLIVLQFIKSACVFPTQYPLQDIQCQRPIGNRQRETSETKKHEVCKLRLSLWILPPNQQNYTVNCNTCAKFGKLFFASSSLAPDLYKYSSRPLQE